MMHMLEGFQLLISGTIKNCHNYSRVISGKGPGACGGITGYSTGADILDCSNKGKIEGENGGMGGITGFSFFTKIYNCYNEGEIDTSAAAAAGIVGDCQSSWIKNCYNLRKN